MKKQHTALAAAVLLMGSVGLAQAGSAGSTSANPGTPAAGTAAPMSETFTTLDRNKDGAISKAEAKRHSALNKSFDKVDSSKDGSLDLAEFAQFEMTETPTVDPGSAPASGSTPMGPGY